MKTKSFKILTLSFILILLFSFNGFAATNVSVYVDNEKIEFDVNPIIENGRTLIPLRGVFEKLGANVDWNKNLSEVVIKDKSNEIEMLLGKNKVMVNGEIKDIDVPTIMINSRTFAPLRFITENLGHTVTWDGSTNSVYITKNNNVPLSQNKILTVGSKENLIALLEYNSKLYNYVWRERGVFLDDSVSSEKSESATEAPAAAPEAAPQENSSNTNNQVEGVQEGDIIKNDGKYIYINTSSGLKIIDSNPQKPNVVSTVQVPENTSISEIFLSGKKLIIIGQNNMFHIMSYNGLESEKMIAPPRYYDDRTNVLIYNIENIEKPKLEKEYLFDGNYLSGRTIEDKLYLVSTKYINYYSYDIYNKNTEDIPVPYYTDVLSNTKHEFTYDKIKYFPNYIDSRYMYTVGINLSDVASKPDVDVYLGGSNTIYVSKDSMYAAIADYSYDYTAEQKEIYNPVYTYSTVIYKFKLNEGNIDVVSQGRVPGNIINQFSMDEHEGNFRIATTTGEMLQNTSKNNVYILNSDLKTIGKLEGLAEGERIYSTRFAGDRIYMVTFKQVDPLFVIDASDPTRPTVKGQLKIPGYSTYLHMVDENHIFGFGYDTDENQWGGTVTGGLKISLFDVTRPDNPKELYAEVIGKSGTYSELLYNHKALMFSTYKGLMAFPVNAAGENYKTEFNGAYVYNIKNDSFSFKNKISHMNAEDYSYGDEVIRIIYINDYLYTFSENKMQVHSIENNKKIGELSIKQ